MYPQFTPAGNFIVFEAVDDFGTQSIDAINVNGTGRQTRTKTGTPGGRTSSTRRQWSRFCPSRPPARHGCRFRRSRSSRPVPPATPATVGATGTIDLSNLLKLPVDLSNLLKLPVDLSNLLKLPVDLSNLLKLPVDLSNLLKLPVDLSNLLKLPVDLSNLLKLPGVEQSLSIRSRRCRLNRSGTRSSTRRSSRPGLGRASR